MRCEAIYTTLVFALILLLSEPPVVRAGASKATAERVVGPETTSISSPPPAASAAQEIAVLRDDMPPKRLPLAPRSLGLMLVGTVVAEDAKMSLAIIEQDGAVKQKIYYEGAHVGKARIKSILRNEVIVDTGRGDQRLTMLHGQAPGSSGSGRSVSRQAAQQVVSSRRLPGRHRTVRLDLKKVASALGDVDKLMQVVSLSRVTSFHRTAGFRITNIPPGSILSEIGLRNGAVVKAVDGEKITDPEQVAKFLRRVREGGQVTLTVNKRRRTRHIHLEIQ